MLFSETMNRYEGEQADNTSEPPTQFQETGYPPSIDEIHQE